MKKENNKKSILGFSIGDVNGIGPEILIKSLSNKKLIDLFTPIIFCNPEIIDYYCKLFKKKINYNLIHSINNISSNRINIIKVSNENVEINPGKIKRKTGNHAFKSLEITTDHLIKNEIDGIVTLPINKKNIQSEKFNFPGQTEYFHIKLKSKNYLMMMLSKKIKIGIYSGHIPFKEITNKLTINKLKNKIKVLINSLKKDFNIKKPKIAVLGLNPHAGERRMLGNEEKKIIEPVIEIVNEKNRLVYGPFSSDAYFGSNKFKKYDATFALYHDQALIPFKMLSFYEGVNFTSGMKYIRTSPDHGTAYDIAGKNLANNTSLDNSILLNLQIINNRKNY